MNKPIQDAFERARSQNRSAFIPFLTGGFPDLKECPSLLKALDAHGADILEVGVPFSDPLADGPVIQMSSKVALEAGATLEAVLELILGLKGALRSPLVVMTYWNPVLKMDPGTFARAAGEAGVSGVIVPDLPPEEAGPWVETARQRGLATVFLVAPTTPPSRLQTILSVCEGFVYLVSMTGVTGSNLQVTEQISRMVASLRAKSRLPVAVGFGISNPQQASALASFSDGIIVGSAILRALMNERDRPSRLARIKALAQGFHKALIRNTNQPEANGEHDHDPA